MIWKKGLVSFFYARLVIRLTRLCLNCEVTGMDIEGVEMYCTNERTISKQRIGCSTKNRVQYIQSVANNTWGWSNNISS